MSSSQLYKSGSAFSATTAELDTTFKVKSTEIGRDMPVITKDGKYLGLVERVGDAEIRIAGMQHPLPIKWVSRVMNREVYVCRSKQDIEEALVWARPS